MRGLKKLREAGLTAAGVVAAFHRRSVLPLVQRPLFMYQMTPDASLFGTRMLKEPVPAAEIKRRVERTVAPELARDF